MIPPGPIVLVTRPEPGAADTAARLAARGFRPVLTPLLTILPRPLRDPAGPLAAVLATSGNAIAALEPLRLASGGTLPFLAVGDETARRARAAGWTAVASAGRDARALAELASSRLMERARPPADAGPRPDGKPLLLASGAGQGHALAADLRARGFRVIRRVAYAQAPVRRLPPQFAEALAEALGHAADAHAPGAVLFLSRSAASAFAAVLPDALRPALRRFRALAISDVAASPIAALPWAAVRVAVRPTQEEVLSLL